MDMLLLVELDDQSSTNVGSDYHYNEDRAEYQRCLPVSNESDDKSSRECGYGGDPKSKFACDGKIFIVSGQLNMESLKMTTDSVHGFASIRENNIQLFESTKTGTLAGGYADTCVYVSGGVHTHDEPKPVPRQFGRVAQLK